MSSDTDTDTTGGIDTDDTVTNPENVGTTITMKDSHFEPSKRLQESDLLWERNR
jgi:hypothetical protein